MNLIPLQSAQFSQQRDVDNNEWKLQDDQGNSLGKNLPGGLTPKEAMAYLHFARPFELKALNIVINFGKEEIRKDADLKILQLVEQIKFLEQQNILLSTKLEKFIIGPDEENI